jgi:hypothetical protein
MGSGGDPANIVNLCGTHGMGGRDGKGGCHDFCDNTAAGREWKIQKRAELLAYYENK